MQDFEKLGVFYLGREYDLTRRAAEDSLILYDSKDLVTHAVCVGMTGSGKTGLCISLIEEAAIDGIPSILIDPKGDLSNLFLTFPQLRGEDFLPWINAEDAAKKGLSPEDYANQQAATWKKGLGDWGEDGGRIQRLRDAAEFAIYTPGSNAGMPVSILKSFAVPPFEILDDGEMLQERINTTVTSLLGMVGISADPLTSREHILVSTIIARTWLDGHDLDLASLIQAIQTPPMTRIGVLDLEAFYPARDRFNLVLALNNLVASPGFATWMEGVPLDIGQILYTPKGKPRVAIFSIAHLGDAERMFFVSLLLNQFLGWMRTQSGTTSLRALVYMDEIFGYFPPVANPPSKLPLLTLLKQARAFGVGIVLATQNPVDLDYKGLSNTGTWFIGRLQTERDKARVMDGLEGAVTAAGASFDRSRMEQIISGLGNRVFLMNNTHEDEPVVFTTRWAMSYLRGPLTRSQIKILMDPYKARLPIAAPAAATRTRPAPAAAVTEAPDDAAPPF
ncbi:MAG: ATP-binding protein, partial [Anaerolineae bacterium]